MAKASLSLIFSTLSRKDLCLLIPAIALAALSGVVPTLMAKIIGEAFNAFAYFNPNNLPVSEVTQESKVVLREAIYQAVWQLCTLGGATMVLSTVMISLWIVVGEKVARGWRIKVYEGFDTKDMAWFEHDLKEKAGQEQGSGSVGAGGIMAKFSRETDEVRIASGQVFGQSLETLATIVSSLLLAFLSCWSLTLVILASIPLTAVLVGFVQSKALPLHENEMENMARASNILERCIQSITTIKAFATEDRERSLFMEHVDKATQAWNRLALIYGGRLGLSATLTLVMFTSGFWYGSMLVQQGKTTPGSVITTFWSCLLIGNSLGTIMSTLNLIEVGKVSAGSLVDLISESKREVAPLRAVRICSATPPSASSSLQAHPWQEFSDSKPLPMTPSSTAASSTKTMQQHQSRRPIVPMRKIRPSQPLQGEVNIQGLTFSYPSRPTEPVLQDISMFFPAGELTFIIGGSGSGKSTLSHLLLRLYDDYVGEILLDDHDIRYLDAEWTRSHVAALDQSAIIFDMSVSDNIALGRCGTLDSSLAGNASKANHVPYVELPLIVDACKMALLHNDIQQLDQGYNTLLGAGGIDLSGGQKQRLALARAIIRDPPVLILDECTSALDVKSRTLITAFIKQWRRGKTTIMITHDLSQVEEDDFVYFLEKGRLVEQGYRSDLTANEDALFSQYVRSQTGTLKGGAVGVDLHSDSDVGQQEEPAEKIELCGSPTGLEWRASTALRRWSQVSTARLGNSHARASRWGADASFDVRPLSRMNPLGSVFPSEKMLRHGKQDSISSISSDSTVSSSGGLRMLQLPQVQQLRQIQKEEVKDTLELASVVASIRRPELRSRKAWDDDELYSQIAPPAQHQWSFTSMQEAKKPTRFWRSDTEGYINEEEEGHCTKLTTSKRERRTLMSALGMAWTTQPKKGILSLGLLVTVLGGGVQPAFSFILGKLLATMGRAGQQELVLQYSLVVLGLAFIDGIVNFARFALLQYSANVWIRSLRFRAFSKVFSQDKAWFDREENSSSSLLTKIIKDGEDAKSFVSRIIGELLLVTALVTTAFIWSLIVSWQLTLVGAIMVPVFYGVVVVQSRLINRFERQNKLQRERVSKRFYNMLHNIRGIRSMSLEIVFWENFHDAVRWVEQYGVRSAPLSGLGYGLKDACIYFAQALLYIVGTYLLIEGKLELSGMLIVLNLLLFAVSFAAEVLAYLPGIAKSLQSIYDLVTILNLEESSSSESSGCAMPHICGSIHFREVDFTYPTRPHDKVLDGCTFGIHSGERVALVGQSGCGKSTIASLLSRMYEPDGGVILLDDSSVKLGDIQTQHLRSKLAFVQQRSDLFDDSIRNNILYGNPQATPAQLERALKMSCSHEIVEQLQDGLDTNIGDTTSSTISGGQKQRLALARALVRDEAKILLLDECTSALDSQTQEKVAENLLTKVPTRRLANKTLLVITHKLEMMKRCDRILVLDKGKVVQSGHFNTLISQKGGVFSKLANAGEWGA